jgi:hypothetical protein
LVTLDAMDAEFDSGAGSDLELIAETRRQMRQLRDAQTRRYRLLCETPEHDAALEAEEQLQVQVWALDAAAGDAES